MSTLHRITVAILALFALSARAADDWIDELPTVTAVGHAVAEQLKVDTADWRFDMRGIAFKDDDDLFAVYMVGTLVLLRQIILYKYQEDEDLWTEEELSAEKPSSPEREAARKARQAKLKSIVAAYLEAELLVGKGVGKRRGYLTTAQKCSDNDCYRRWFKIGIGNVRNASYRGRVLPRLFCRDRAAELDRLAQSNAPRAPYLPSPAETDSIEPELACIAPKGCLTYGGDANHNWLCEDWENPRKTPLSKASASPCPARVPTEARAAPRDGECSRPGQPVFSCPEGRECKTWDSPWVEVRTGITATQDGNTGKSEEKEFKEFKDCDGQTVRLEVPPKGRVEDGITIRVKCANGHVVQFISREYWLEEGREQAQYRVTDPENPSQLLCFDLSIEEESRKWRTDSRGKPNPYYETSGSYATTCDSMTIFDAPSVKLPQGGKYRARRVLAKSFAVCDGKIVSVVDWARQHDSREPQPSYQVDPPREPTPEEIEQFRRRSCAEDFNPWP
jgi:hypothetical protein